MKVLELLTTAGWVMIPLALASILALTLIVYSLFTLHENIVLTAETRLRLEELYRGTNVLDGVRGFVADRPQAVTRILSEVLKFRERCPSATPDALLAVAESAGNRFAASWQQRITFILDVAVLAPMLGLFGTVVGILKSFGSIATEPSPMRTMLLAGGVSEALVATAAGLIVGIFAMAAYSFLRGRVNHLISLLEAQTTEFVQLLLAHHQPRA